MISAVESPRGKVKVMSTMAGNQPHNNSYKLQDHAVHVLVLRV